MHKNKSCAQSLLDIPFPSACASAWGLLGLDSNVAWKILNIRVEDLKLLA